MDHAVEAQRTDLMTVTRHVLNEQSKHPEARGDFSILLYHIVLGCKFVCNAVNKAGLAKLIGLAGETNTQGEEQKKLDVLSNEVFVKALISSERTCVLVSEEDEEATFVESSKRGRYCVVFDPLDGSSNIDCGVSVGTIFGIYMVKDKDKPTLEDVLQPGKNMLAAGYCMYGSSCMLVLSTGNGVNGFTLDPSLREFILTHPDIKIPKKGNIYSINEGNAKYWDDPTANMVADVHRTLLYGGIFLYPADKKCPNGKLRVLYEVFPMSYLMEQAGGQAFTGKQPLVLSTGNGVNGFTLDPSLGEFILTHPDIKIPNKGNIYSINEGNAKYWDDPTAKYVEKCKFPIDGSSPKSLRYIGSMVADVHRTLLYGGIFLYPADKKCPNGKLRVLYEVFPMSYLMEQAGGQDFRGKQPALELVPKKIHERSPIFLGSHDDMEEIKVLYAAAEVEKE